jgi:hypothetical protein
MLHLGWEHLVDHRLLLLHYLIKKCCLILEKPKGRVGHFTYALEPGFGLY